MQTLRQSSDGKVWRTSYFKDVPVGAALQCNGNTWRKRSTRTAQIVSPERYAGAWFYFGQRDVCETQA